MKRKIGILHGKESSFPEAFVERINEKNESGIIAEPVLIESVVQGREQGYAVIFDRISQDVPFYRGMLKNAAITGTAVVNNPFWWSADEKFFNNALALQVGVPVPKTVLLPSKDRPNDTSDQSFRNLRFPMDWEGMFEYLGPLMFMKPFDGGGWKSVFKLHSKQEFFEKYQETGQLVMLLQEAIEFTDYFRCYCIGGKHVRIMRYEPDNPHHLRYESAKGEASKEMLSTIHDYVLRLNKALGYDFNTVEFAVRDGIPYAIDFCNPAPDADVNSVGQENFDWVVETSANFAIEKAKEYKEGVMNLTWGTFMQQAVNGKKIENVSGKKASKKEDSEGKKASASKGK
jgi:glutathione synthase/RimK-type ligase-like ATP-grasp enzyme